MSGPLSEHELSHVVADLHEARMSGSFGASLDRRDVAAILEEAGYVRLVGYAPDTAIGECVLDQVWGAYDASVVKCAVCDNHATHMWGSLQTDGSYGSIAGPGVLAPSCDGCGGDKYDDGADSGVIRAPLDFRLEPKAEDRDSITRFGMRALIALLDQDAACRVNDAVALKREFSKSITQRVGEIIAEVKRLEDELRLERSKSPDVISHGNYFVNSPPRLLTGSDLADIVGHDPDFLPGILRAMDLGEARTALTIAVRAFAQHVAKVTANELRPTSFAEVLLSLVVEVEVGD